MTGQHNDHYYITTPIYYLSGTPHIGTAYTSIAADVLARFHALDGKATKFLTGTDEHGLKVLRCAEKEGLGAQEYCDREVEKFKDLTPLLHLSNDDFIRTTQERHIKAAQHLWTVLQEKGFIYKDSYSGWYAVSDEAYYDESEIEKRGDGKKYATSSGSKVEWMEEESYFFKLSAFEDKLLAYYETDAVLPRTRANEVASFVKSGLKDLSISRTTFDWGIPVPGDDKHVMYVWIDALTNYMSALGYPENTTEMERLWPNTTHLVGKDILRFHAIYWPAFLMAADLPLPKTIFAHGWLTLKGEKMSKSKGNVILPSELVDGYGVDQTRYFLMREVPFGNDGSISHEAFVNRVNADLANNFGNLAQRTLSMIYKNCDGKIPSYGDLTANDLALFEKTEKPLLQSLQRLMENCKIHEYLKSVIAVSSDANEYIDAQEPWSLKKTDIERMKTVLYVLAEVIRRIAILLQPIAPESASKVLDQLEISEDMRQFSHIIDASLKPDVKIQKPEGVFPRLEIKEEDS